MKSFAVFYNNGVGEGLPFPRGEEALLNNQKVMKERLEANWNQIEVAKVLEGLVVNSRQEFTGSLCVSGPQEKIDRLKAFLEEKNLGTVVPNEAMFRGAEDDRLSEDPASTLVSDATRTEVRFIDLHFTTEG